MENDGGTQVTQVGEGFNPGPAANAAIASLLGMTAEVRDDAAWIFIADLKGVPTRAAGWAPCPDYCNDTVAVAELMEFEGHVPYVKPVMEISDKGRKLKRFICFFDHAGDVCVTVPFKKGSHALAAALHHVLESKS